MTPELIQKTAREYLRPSNRTILTITPKEQVIMMCLLFVAVLSVAPCLCAQTPFPSEPPKPGAPRDFRVPEARRFTLDNGLQVALVPWGNMPKVRVTLTVRTGNAFEKASEVWLADLTGELMREGTATRSATEISTEAARMGGSLDVSVGGDIDHDRRGRPERVRRRSSRPRC